MKREAIFTFHFSTIKEAHLVGVSLFPEIKEKISKTNITLTQHKKSMTLHIQAQDTSSLRASCNSYLRWIHTALKVQQLL